MPSPGTTRVASHRYAFTARDVLRAFSPCLAGCGAIAVALHLASLARLLPDPTPADLDRTVISEKVRMAREPRPAGITLVGDSSCLMDVDTPRLAQATRVPAVNLGTLSYLHLAEQALLLEASRRARGPGDQGGLVILLMHPDTLRRSGGDPAYAAFLRARLADTASTADTAWGRAFPAATFRESVIQRWIPVALRGDFGVAYGSLDEVRRHLRRHDGSLVDPTPFVRAAQDGTRELRTAEGLERASRAFRRSIPAGTRLAVGITPLPATLASPEHADAIRTLTRTWAGWMEADVALDSLPAVLPEDHFATRTHLNARGIAVFTESLHRALEPVLGNRTK